MLTQSQVISIVRRSIKESTGVPYEYINLDSTLAQVGIDSDDKIILLTNLTAQRVAGFGHQISKAVFRQINPDITIRILADLVRNNSTSLEDITPKLPDDFQKERFQDIGTYRGLKKPEEGKQGAKYVSVSVFYGTDRARTGSDNPNEFFGYFRGEFEYGMCEVSIPKSHAIGKLERPGWWRLEFKENPEKHIALLKLLPMQEGIFFRSLQEVVSDSSEKDAFVFVHGFNVTFAEAARRTAQLAVDLSFKGAAIMYSWPSRGEITGYLGDEDNVKLTVDNLIRFLKGIVVSSSARRIHLIAHSMGNRALTDALKELRQREETTHFNQVILTAPDIDADIFTKQIAPAISKVSERITLYTSSEDKALAMSRKIRGRYARAGESGPGIVVVEGIDTVDASGVRTDSLGHGYFADNALLINDIFILFRHGFSPNQRNLRSHEKNDLMYWEFPKE